MRTRFCCLLFVALSLSTLQGFSMNDLFFRHLDSGNGLSDNQVRGILAAPDGRIIARTVGMINFYDATTFRYSRFNAQKTYKWSYSSFEYEYIDRDDRLWMKENGQLLLFNLKSNQFDYSISDFLSSFGIAEPIKDFFLDVDRDFWIVSQSNNLFFGNDRLGKSTLVLNLSIQDARFNHVLSLTQSDKLVFILFQSGWIKVFDKQQQRFVYDLDFLQGRIGRETIRYMMKPDADGTVWIMFNGDKGGVFSYRPKTKAWTTRLSFADFYTFFDIDRTGTVWVGTRDGLWIVRKNQLPEKITSFKLLEGGSLFNDINTVYADPQGGIWLGTFNQGILYYHPSILKFREYNKRTTNMVEDGVRCLSETSTGTILVGTVHGLLEFDPVSERFSSYHATLNDAFCLQLYWDRQGRLWVPALNRGLYCLDGKKVRLYRAGLVEGGIQDNNVRSIFQDTDGAFYLSTLMGGFGRFDPETGRFDPLKKKYPSLADVRLITHMLPFGKKELLVAAQNGLFLYNSSSGNIHFPKIGSEPLDSAFRHSNNKYNSIIKDSRGYYWFGTQVGLNVWCPDINRTYSFYLEQGLSNNGIQSVIEDLQHEIWVSTSNGLTRIHVNLKDRLPDFTMVNFNRQDGLIEGEFYERSALLTRSGMLYFGGINGFNRVDPAHISFGMDHIRPVFVKLKLFNTDIEENGMYKNKVILKKAITQTDRLSLKYNQNFITLEFSALNYINPTQTYFKYRLEGFDRDWTQVLSSDGTGRVTYTGLRPGHYCLKVYAANGSRNWDSNFAALDIDIKAPFWATPMAYLLYFLIFGFLLLYLIEWRIRSNKRKFLQKQEEERRIEKDKLDQMKFRFFTNISHEFRTPLTLILTPLDAILKRLTDESLKKQLWTVHKSASDLLALVNQLLDFRKLEMSGEKLMLSYCNIMEFMDTIYETFREVAIEKNIAFNIEHRKANLFLYIDKDKVHKILNNLLSNAFKFTPEGGIIHIRIGVDAPPTNAKSQTEYLRIDVADTGVGMPEQELANIFNRFYQAGNQPQTNTGSGIGLHLVREYVRLHTGFVTATSEENKGSEFRIYIPLDLHPDTEIAANTTENEVQETPMEEVKAEHGMLTLLVVEDNLEFRNFLAESLAENYQVILASNGQEASDLLQMNSPDLVISDIMMPVMDGIELCRRIKTDIQTSHIPVILLTAKISEEYQLVGYEAGADAYIAKPFNMDILFMRIRKLIEQQENRKVLFQKTIDVNPSSITITSLDEKLVQKALDCVERNMDNPEYSVEELSTDIGMNRTQLYRKLHSIVGMTPSDFIRSIRLKRAAQLMEKSQLSVAEVADLVGFNTHKYFSKYFKEMFGVYPSQYGKNAQTK